MLTVLAQSRSTSPFRDGCDAITSVFSHGDALAQPDFLIEQLRTLPVVWAVVFLIVGLLCMLSGYRFYKITTIGIAFLVGMFAGYGLGYRIGAPEIVGGCLGLLLATAAFPLMKYAVSILGGLAGAFIGANLWSGLAHATTEGSFVNFPPDAYWVGALVGLLTFGMLAFIVYKLSIVLFTSVSGSTIAVLGGIALLLSFEPWRQSIDNGLTAHKLIIPLLVLIPAVMGLILQEVWSSDVPAPSDG